MPIAQEVAYEHLARLPLVRSYEKAFRKATGVALRLVPAGPPSEWLPHWSCRNALCRLLARNPQLEQICWATHERQAQHLADGSLVAQTVRCFAGLSALSAPVVVEGRHVATWIGGQVCCRKLTRADFRRVAARLEEAGIKGKRREIEAALFGVRVVSEQKLMAMKELLTLMAQHLEQHLDEEGNRLWAVCRCGEPRSVTRAKEFVQEHVSEPIRLRQVAAAVHTSPRRLWQDFEEATGMTFNAYTLRVRVERAKALLMDLSLNVSQVASASGFRSIAQFRTWFRKSVGKTPREFRDMRGAG